LGSWSFRGGVAERGELPTIKIGTLAKKLQRKRTQRWGSGGRRFESSRPDFKPAEGQAVPRFTGKIIYGDGREYAVTGEWHLTRPGPNVAGWEGTIDLPANYGLEVGPITLEVGGKRCQALVADGGPRFVGNGAPPA
jgi:hypothetical protein